MPALSKGTLIVVMGRSVQGSSRACRRARSGPSGVLGTRSPSRRRPGIVSGEIVAGNERALPLPASLEQDGRMTRASDELGAFLRACRAQLQPRDVGLA